jgi:hypothetical protein
MSASIMRLDPADKPQRARASAGRWHADAVCRLQPALRQTHPALHRMPGTLDVYCWGDLSSVFSQALKHLISFQAAASASRDCARSRQTAQAAGIHPIHELTRISRYSSIFVMIFKPLATSHDSLSSWNSISVNVNLSKVEN